MGIKGTKLFHSLIKRNAWKNFIATLVKEDGSFTTSTAGIHEEFLNFYAGLLGTKQDTHGFDEAVMVEGPMVTPAQLIYWLLILPEKKLKLPYLT